jgi:FlaA1/EpsC-like NDP-sugar epimerase
LVERSENGLFFIHREISQKMPGVEVRPVLLDITDEQAVRREFLKASPDIVFHAAAHKHVGMMQHWPAEAVKNNIIGTLTVARAAAAAGAERFVNISTDKAVRPKSFMGLSKRLAEGCVAEMNLGSRTQFVTVRFGNVAGSVGSVVQLFRQQIEAGGPVTVTDREARRYFMTIPEAVRLVLQAAVFSQSRGLFVLDMREPIEIQDLARTMISLAGYVPGEDIRIEFTRLGEAEKLTEELQDESERLVSTGHERVWRIAKTVADPSVAERALRWRELLAQGRPETVLDEVREQWALLDNPAPVASVARAS